MEPRDTSTEWRVQRDVEYAPTPQYAGGKVGEVGLKLVCIDLQRCARQLWNRALGHRVTGPDAGAAAAEEAIRVGAGSAEVRFLKFIGSRYVAVSQPHQRGNSLMKMVSSSAWLILLLLGIQSWPQEVPAQTPPPAK